MFRLTVIDPSAFTVTFDTGITPIPPSNLTRVSSAPSGETMPMHNTDANSAFFIARLPPLTAALHET